jgi:hypothetical protein
MRLRRVLAALSAAAAVAVAACDVPFAPKWDADVYLPLSTQPVRLSQFVPPAPNNVILGGASLSISFVPLVQDVAGPIRDVLKNAESALDKCRSTANPALMCHVLAVTTTKTTAISAQDTLFVSPDSLGLYTARPGGIVFPIPLAATDLARTDSLFLSTAQFGMLQNAAETDQGLWIQLRGRVSNPSASPVTITAADSIGIRLAATLRIRVSHR